VVWQLVVGGDFAFPQTTGPRPTGAGLVNRYVDRLVRTAHDDAAVSEALARVTRLETPPTELFRPQIAWRVLRPSAHTASVRAAATRAVHAVASKTT